MQKLNRLLITLSAALILSACGPQKFSDSSSREGIINGHVASSNDTNTKSVVGIYLDTKMGSRPLRQLCTGTLIAKDLVLTAAHCMDENITDRADKLLVSFGGKTIKTEADLQLVTLRRVARMKHHENWEPIIAVADIQAPLYDIALLKLEEEAPGGFVSAQLPSADLTLNEGNEVMVYGFGYTGQSKLVEADNLMSANLKVNNWEFSPTHFQSLVDPTGTCSGDSGGPAFIKDNNGKLVVVGVTSFGDKSCHVSSYFTRVPTFKNWLTKAIQSLY
jgi:secreted trypsin-like serine protease